MSTTTEIQWPVVEECSRPFVVRGCVLPEAIRDSLDRYARFGVPTGNFLEAVLANDLFDALRRADDDNMAVLVSIVGYVYNALPMTCWGTREMVKTHIAKWFPLSQEHRPNPVESKVPA